MITKIKKFKLAIRKREVLKILKILEDIKKITPELEETVEQQINKVRELLSPASIFSTFSIKEAIENFAIEVKSDKLVSISVIVVTLGEKIETEVQQMRSRGEYLHSQILHAIGMEGCNSSLNFIYRLLQEEAQEDHCELLPPEEVKVETQNLIIDKLNTKRIGVYLDKNRLMPVYSSIATVGWLPKRR